MDISTKAPASKAPHALSQGVKPLPLKSVKLTEGMPLLMQQLVREQVLMYQWRTLNDQTEGAVKSHCIENFRITAGLTSGEHYGVVFLDSDLYKWLEAVAFTIEVTGDAQLTALADEAIELIGGAQQADGYINTYFTIKEPEGRFSNLLEGHELYCAGHFFEAAVAYHHATGKRAVLDIACRFADCLVRTFGTGAGQIPGYPGHQVVELGLIKLYRATGNDAYLNLADYFIAQRGQQPSYFEAERARPGYHSIFGLPFMSVPSYSQSHLPPAQQTEAVGHAVRALYMYSAMADLARERDDAALGRACEMLYKNVTERRMYVTGGVGSTAYGESFTGDYDLPNDTMYGESCASVALMMFASRMAALTGEGAYYDAVERAFFNQVLGGISLTGQEFFYVGALAVNPDACRVNPGLEHVKPVRQRWFDVACCPTNIARTIMSIGGYAFGEDGDTLYIHIPLACRIETERFALSLQTGYPYDGALRVEIEGEMQNLAIRASALSPIVTITVNGQAVNACAVNGYVTLRDLSRGDVIEIAYDLTPHYVVSSPKVTANVGKAAVMRGPIVYCAEQADNGAGIACLILPREPRFSESECFAGGGTVKLAVRGARTVFTNEEALYQHALPQEAAADISLIPYHLWANRGEGEMQVYLRVQ